MRRLALCGVLAACGDGLTVPDARVAPDVDRGLVTVQVRSHRLVNGARVFFQQADSQLVLATTTDAEGRAQAYTPPGSFVTVELTEISMGVFETRYLFTQVDVNPGDEVVIDDGTTAAQASLTMTVTVPPATPDLLTTTFSLLGPCTISPSELAPDQPTLMTFTGCPQTASVIVESKFSSGDRGYLLRKNVLISDGVSLQFTGAYRPLTTTRLRVASVPPSIRRMDAAQTLLDGPRELFGAPTRTLFFDRFEPSAELALATLPWDDARAITKLSTTDGVGIANLWEWGPRSEPVHTIEWGTDAVRPYLAYPQYSPRANIVGWIEGDRGRRADAVLVQLYWTARTDLRELDVYWNLFTARGDETWVTLPSLPDLLLRPTNAFVEDVTNFAIEGGYERLRSLPLLARWPHFGASPSWPIDAPEGRVTFTSVTGLGGLPRN